MCIYLTKLNDVFELKHNQTSNGEKYKIRIDHSSRTGVMSVCQYSSGQSLFSPHRNNKQL